MECNLICMVLTPITCNFHVLHDGVMLDDATYINIIQIVCLPASFFNLTLIIISVKTPDELVSVECTELCRAKMSSEIWVTQQITILHSLHLRVNVLKLTAVYFEELTNRRLDQVDLLSLP